MARSQNIKRTPRPLTLRQRQAWEYIASEVRRLGYPPTLREIGDRMKIGSTNGVRCLMEALEKKGFIRRAPFLSRGIELLKRPVVGNEASEMVRVPIVGRVAAGAPLLAEQNIEGELLIDRALFPAGDGFALRVKGESMIEAGIRDGDIVMARPDLPLDTGSIVVALIDDEATVKYYFPDRNGVKLVPGNPQFQPIFVECNTPGFHVVGKVVGLFRRY